MHPVVAALTLIIPMEVPDALTPASPGSVRITGRLGRKLDLCVENRLLSQNVEDLVAPYRAKTETGVTDWRCEYWGKWFTSLTLADAYRSTRATRGKRDEATQALLATAASDGYLGTRTPAHRLEGWDVWGRKYALLGLLADYDRTQNPKVLIAAKRHADTLIAELGPGKTNIADVGEWNGLAASSVLEPVVLLYERTRERKYLDFANHIVARWSEPSKRLPTGMRLVEDALAGKNPVQMCTPKSYEMMSCFEGLCELYRVTGHREYRDASVKLGEGILREEATVVGVGTRGEIWFGGANRQTEAVHMPMETCVTVTWMKLCDQLLRLTGDAHYADELEKNLYNGLLGAMMPDGKWWAYFSGLSGPRVPSYVQHSDVNLSCCVVNGPRALMATPFWAFMRRPEGPVVNLYAPGTAQLGDVELEVRGDYPVGDRSEIRVNPKRTEDFTLSLRIPAWSKKTDLRVNGRPWPVTPGYTRIRRIWHPKDLVTLTFDIQPKAVSLNGQTSFQRGPVVLALDNRFTPGEGRLPSNPVLKPNSAAARKIGAWMAYDLGGLTLCDYASAGNAFAEGNVFRTWLPPVVDPATVFQTGQTWPTLSHAPRWTNPPLPRLRVENPARDLALTATVTSSSEFSREPNGTSKAIDGIIATPEDFTNRWHSSIDVPHPHWIELRFAKPKKIRRAIVHFADPEGYPVDLEATVSGDHPLFRIRDNRDPRKVDVKFAPLATDRFRLTIHASANPRYPNAAQISEIEIYE